MECQSSFSQVSIEGINRHLTADIFSTHQLLYKNTETLDSAPDDLSITCLQHRPKLTNTYSALNDLLI